MSADHSVHINTFCWQEAVSVAVAELGFHNKHSPVTWDTVQYTERSGRALLHQTVEDETQFAVGISVL